MMNQIILTATTLFPAMVALAEPITQYAPAALSSDQCINGNCGASVPEEGSKNALEEDAVDADADAPPDPLAMNLPDFKAHIKQTMEPIPPDVLYEILEDSIGVMNKHIERSYISNIAFPSALEDTMAKSGNYSDGTTAGSPSWVGDEGAQNATRPLYASFGSVLHMSSGDGLMSWLASLFHRKSIVDSNEDVNRPCRMDLLDDWDGGECLVGLTIEDYTSIRTSMDATRMDMVNAIKYDVLDRGEFLVHENGNWIDMDIDAMFGDKKFDTIFADSVLGAFDDGDDGNAAIPMHDMDLVIERLIKLLKPGGTLYMIGKQRHARIEGDAISVLHSDIVHMLDAAKSLTRETPKHDLPATWVHRTTKRLGLNIFSSTLFPTYYTQYDMFSLIEEAKEWVEFLKGEFDRKTEESFLSVLDSLNARVEQVMDGEEVFTGGYDYVIAAEFPLIPDAPVTTAFPRPIEYKGKRKYDKDHDPWVEKLAMPPIEPGEFQFYKWANGDAYDGVSARIGIEAKLADTIRDYIKELGIWDLIIDTITGDPMPKNSTRFYNIESIYEKGKNFTWSAKRPDNFYGSDSDMHWFDVADEAAHEESLRVLAKGGFDQVLQAAGKALGLDHLVSFGIGILAVTKADKGYVHVDFSNSKKRAFNFLINLQTPGQDPELTVIEEDDIGNRRRGQVKYAPEFGVLNGDDAMHATNECNHRENGGVRITASIFIAELVEESLYQVATHDKYYFPFGNMDWIWAQRGRHWNKEGTVSLVEDKGRNHFEPHDEMDGCEEKVGDNNEKCLVHGAERMLCYKTCGAFIADEVYQPGEQRRSIFGW